MTIEYMRNSHGGNRKKMQLGTWRNYQLYSLGHSHPFAHLASAASPHPLCLRRGSRGLRCTRLPLASAIKPTVSASSSSTRRRSPLEANEVDAAAPHIYCPLNLPHGDRPTNVTRMATNSSFLEIFLKMAFSYGIITS